MNRRIRQVAAAAAVVLACGGVAVNPAGSEQLARDLGFGHSAAQTIDFAEDFDQASALVLQPDGKLLMAGSVFIDGDSDMAVIRLNPDGSFDTGFGDQGTVTFNSGNGGHDSLYDLVLLPDGKIVLAGTFGGTQTFIGTDVLVGLKADGSIDAGFGVDGIVPTGTIIGAHLALQPDGKIVVAGSTNQQSDGVIARFLPYGAPDPGFGSGGAIVIDTGSTAAQQRVEELSDVTVLDDGSILAAGYHSVTTTTFPTSDGLLVRVSAAGQLDSAFNGTGYRIIDEVPGGEWTSAVLSDTGGSAIVSLAGNPPFLARVRPDGSFDPSFGQAGFAQIQVEALARDAQGRIVTATGGEVYQLRRWSSDGRLDLTFNGGAFQSDVMPDRDFPVSLAIQPDGRVLVAGYGYDLSQHPASGQYATDWFLERFVFSPDPPPSPPEPPSPPPGLPPSPPEPPSPPFTTATTKSGYWLIGQTGLVYPFGDAARLGDIPVATGRQAVDVESAPDGAGYWTVDNLGTVTGRGSAMLVGGSPPLAAGEIVTSLSSTPDGKGYWLFTSAGRVWPYGNAQSYGDMAGVKLNGPVLDSVPTPSGHGYYMVASDGGVFTFGDANFIGSMAMVRLNAPVRSLVPDSDGAGYWLVAGDGGVFAFDAPFRNSMGGRPLNKLIIGMVPYGNAYLMVASDGGVFNFATDKPFAGSLGANPPSAPIAALAAMR